MVQGESNPRKRKKKPKKESYTMNKMLNVYWTINETAKVDIGTAKNALASVGLSETLMDEVTDRRAVKRGVDEMHNRRVKTGNRRISEKIRENSNVAVFGILKCHPLNGETTSYEQDTRVKLNKATGAVEVTGKLADDVLQAIQSNRGVYNDADIRRLCYNLVRSIGGVSKRPSGGVYILPAIFADKIDALRVALKKMVGNNASIFVERIYDGDEENKNMAVSVCEDLQIRVGKVLDAVNAISKQTCRLTAHKANILELRTLTDVYKNILGEQDALKTLNDSLVDAENRIADAIEKVSLKA